MLEEKGHQSDGLAIESPLFSGTYKDKDRDKHEDKHKDKHKQKHKHKRMGESDG